jgi:hypothetical protein
VGVQGNAFWVLDANLACEASYAPQGDSRLIRVAPDGAGARDTIVLTGVRNATGIVVAGNVAFVSSGGLADFSAWPAVTWSAPSRIVKVDLAARRVVSTVTVAPVSNGGGVRLGADGRLYMTVYTATDYSSTEVFAFDQDLNPAGARAAGRNSLALRLANGAAPKCQGAVADALGRVYCPVNGTGSAATLHVFDATGVLLRSVAVGQGAVDVALRPKYLPMRRRRIESSRGRCAACAWADISGVGRPQSRALGHGGTVVDLLGPQADAAEFCGTEARARPIAARGRRRGLFPQRSSPCRNILAAVLGPLAGASAACSRARTAGTGSRSSPAASCRPSPCTRRTCATASRPPRSRSPGTTRWASTTPCSGVAGSDSCSGGASSCRVTT